MAKQTGKSTSAAEAAGWPVLRWGFFVAVVSVCPFVWTALAVSDDFSRDWHLYQLWPHGELALIAFALSADGLNECAFGMDRGRLLGRGGVRFLLVAASLCVLVAAVVVFAKAQLLTQSGPDWRFQEYATASEWAFASSLVVTFVTKVLTEG